MKALDKVFDTQVITGIGDKVHFQNDRNFIYEEEQTRKTVSSYNHYRRKSNRIYQSQSNGTLNDVSILNYIVQLILKNLTVKVLVEHQVIIILKS